MKSKDYTAVTGFSNVRSMEYVLINDLYDKNEFDFFYPFYFWKNRDDTILSLSNNLDEIGLIALFSRRPKTDYVNSDYIEVSFRETLFRQSNLLQQYEIPVIIGLPIGTSILEMGFGAKVQWFIHNSNNNDDEVTYVFKKNDVNKKKANTLNFVNLSDVYDVMSKSRKYTWREVVETIQKWYLAYRNIYNQNRSSFFNTGVQRPVFIVYKKRLLGCE